MTENELKEIFRKANESVVGKADIAAMVGDFIEKLPEEKRSSPYAALTAAMTVAIKLNQDFVFEVLKSLNDPSSKK